MADTPDAVASSSTPAGRKNGSWGRTIAVALLLVLIGIAAAWQMGAMHSRSKIAIFTSTEDVYWDRLFEGGQSAAKYFDAEVITVRCPTDDAVQSQKIRDAMAQGVGGIIVSPVKPEAELTLLKEVASKMPLITVDSDSPNSDRIAFIGTNNYEAGRQCGELVKSALPDGGQVVLCVGSIESDNGRSRRQGFLDVLLDRPPGAPPSTEPADKPIGAGKYTVVTTLLDGADPAKARSLATDAMKNLGDVKCFVGLWSYNTPALLDAAKETGKIGKIKIIGFDDLEPTLAGVESGNVFATLVQDQYNMGFDSVMLMCATLERSHAVDSRPRKASLTCTPLLNAQDVQTFRADRAKAASPQ